MISLLSRNFNPEKLEEFLLSDSFKISGIGKYRSIYYYPLEILRVIYKVYPSQLLSGNAIIRGDIPVENLKFLLEEIGYEHLHSIFYEEIDTLEMLEYVKEKLYLSKSWDRVYFMKPTILYPPRFSSTLQDIKLLRYAMENLGFVPRRFDFEDSSKVKDREVVDILLRYNEPSVVAFHLPLELIGYMKTHHGFIPTLDNTRNELRGWGISYKEDTSRIKELVTSHGYPVSSQLLFMLDMNLFKFLIEELGIVPNEETMFYYRYHLEFIKYLHEVHHIPVSPLLYENIYYSEVMSNKRRQIEEYVMPRLPPLPSVTILASYDGRCPICYEDCTESIFKCGHPHHLACLERSVTRCCICREGLLEPGA